MQLAMKQQPAAYHELIRLGTSLYELTREEVVRACDELHSYMDQGPGPNTSAQANALSTVRRLQAAASWEYPLDLLRHIPVTTGRVVQRPG